MELRDLVKIFEEKKFKTWVCPLINSHCDHDCYGYAPKGFTLLLESKGSAYPQNWGQRFSKSKDIMKWGRSLEKKVIVVAYHIYPPTCTLLDAVINIGGFNA
jgi:hypothetical protein